MGEFRGHVFIGVSVDGFIAKPDGDLAWLTERGESIPDSGYDAFVETIDAMIMGRATYEVASGFEDGWPYEVPVFVISSTLDPEAITEPNVTVHRSREDAVAAFTAAGFTDAYVDGGRTVQSFIAADMIDRIIVTYAPVLIGSGSRLFGDVPADMPLELVSTKDLGADFVQTEYCVLRED